MTGGRTWARREVPAEARPRWEPDPWWRSRCPVRALDPAVATALRNAREAQGWSIRGAAKRMRVDFSYLCKLEHGVRAPSTETAWVLIAAYPGLTSGEVSALLDAARPYSGRSSPYRTGRVPPEEMSSGGGS